MKMGWWATTSVVVLLLAILGPVSQQARVYEVRSDGAVVITGCSSGIGRDAALFLANTSVHVFAGVRTSRDADSILAEASGLGLHKYVEAVIVDVTEADSVAAAASKVATRLQTLNLTLVGIVNNAGIS